MSDTPDTDERAVPHIGFYSCATVPAEFARKLERERDEAREEAQKSKAYKRVLKVTNENLKRERDEAREGLTSQKIVIAQHIVITDLMLERDEAREERENSRQSLGFALEELDEARKEAHRFRSLHYSHLGINGSASAFPWEGK